VRPPAVTRQTWLVRMLPSEEAAQQRDTADEVRDGERMARPSLLISVLNRR
jgi:hypothetical protein